LRSYSSLNYYLQLAGSVNRWMSWKKNSAYLVKSSANCLAKNWAYSVKSSVDWKSWRN
jgi:hypothetical protein